MRWLLSSYGSKTAEAADPGSNQGNLTVKLCGYSVKKKIKTHEPKSCKTTWEATNRPL